MLVIGAVLGALGVMSGAFGAHALQGLLSDKAQGWYGTAVTYHAGHALALLACGLLSLHTGQGPGSRWLQIAGICFTSGTFVFSGSLYAMAFTGITRLGMITPIGGLLLIIAWCTLAVAASRLRPTPVGG
ncbi:hypothetical protein IMCC3135_10590 [Granulosicoccus antarcticus IMCC3135]|uniref:DUF423 domain-containing protein n=2 Tax=Granulosicoccus TaxID=437504 RepID=A0A2Z2NL92_9GAMM|nr:hypothetical protein IMCC3135_10590 [Granulosicoccus antarcticus IMCC3135]